MVNDDDDDWKQYKSSLDKWPPSDFSTEALIEFDIASDVVQLANERLTEESDGDDDTDSCPEFNSGGSLWIEPLFTCQKYGPSLSKTKDFNAINFCQILKSKFHYKQIKLHEVF